MEVGITATLKGCLKQEEFHLHQTVIAPTGIQPLRKDMQTAVARMNLAPIIVCLLVDMNVKVVTRIVQQLHQLLQQVVVSVRED